MPDSEWVQRIATEIKTELSRAESCWWRSLYGSGHYSADFDEPMAKSAMKSSWLSLITLIEACRHGFLLNHARELFEQVLEAPLSTEMGPEEPLLTWQWEARRLLDVVETFWEEGESGSVARSEVASLLRNSQRLIVDRAVFGWRPVDEADVHRRLEGILRSTFPTLLHKPPIAKSIKGFQPDTGIPSVGVLVEYKFLKAKSDAKRIVDEILADLSGYKSPGYGHLVICIYETIRAYSEDEWIRLIEEANPELGVDLVLLCGAEVTSQDVTLRDSAGEKGL